jgi:hypothetical protein
MPNSAASEKTGVIPNFLFWDDSCFIKRESLLHYREVCGELYSDGVAEGLFFSFMPAENRARKKRKRVLEAIWLLLCGVEK